MQIVHAANTCFIKVLRVTASVQDEPRSIDSLDWVVASRNRGGVPISIHSSRKPPCLASHRTIHLHNERQGPQRVCDLVTCPEGTNLGQKRNIHGQCLHPAAHGKEAGLKEFATDLVASALIEACVATQRCSPGIKTAGVAAGVL